MNNFRNLVARKLKKAKREYYDHKFVRSGGNVSGLFLEGN